MSTEYKFTCQGCGLAFQMAEDQRNHFKSDLHRYNMKRRVTGLPPISSEQFKQKFEDSTAAKPTVVQSKPNHIKEKNYNPTKVANKQPEDVKIQPELTEEEIYNERMKNRLSSLDCLFSSHKSSTVEENVRFMEHNFSFYIPDRDFIQNLDGLVQYLADKISIGHTCLFCNKSFTSLESIRKHMLDKSHNKIAYELEEDRDEISDYYDFESSNAQNDDGWEDDEDIQSGEEDEMVEDDSDNKEEREIQYGDTPFELVLPTGRRIGHRSMQMYYKQRPLQQELTEKKHGQQSVTYKMSNSDALIPAKGSGFGAFGEGQQVIHASNKGEARLAKKATRQARDVQRREQFKTKVGFKHNNQKHFRDQLLQ
ncbi:hypothetical protein E3Q22_00495 [Wallemia mellicola]|uniref:C2H2-type domain-containing protein n=2 Tax=Wallemia mellicola TaxID=1708541 RepID=A0A4T0N2M1_9BASI|nr:hypothetical protein WALSEDRAFT_41642 [Wallemia mellicola CBS 633.66]TIB70551.1 hypothetical protein E3Q23_04129 [Wallemia mellicola]EIM19249.1 hypothetical protein WALSEDRAFT_41642 [Wallemia mellicola CBS 633.66]TIB73182.1 hypothetical protein E3Q24_01299 [Wallemia mellicola]TIB82142.1 hypothetical protein E3Q22_00495 [Wallemia mellicola]TIB87667.1 hypothetical protein E3Q21_01259 [Wallemia mellicola]|eukprot:XP_006960746.1 hypothetical protein WALSEDRAFT_41642 [Wallemia mellicola CBS 633.66]